MLYTRTLKEFQTRKNMRHNLEYRNQLSFENLSNNWNWENLHYVTPETDILELDEQYILEIALPGVVLDDVELKIEDNFLTVVAKRTPAMFEEKAAILRKELPSGFYVREFEFETEICVDSIEARLDRGILFVSVPKIEVAQRIPVSAGTIETHLPGMKTRVHKSDMRKEVTIK